MIPILVYAMETRPDTATLKTKMQVIEMKVLRNTLGKTRCNRLRNRNIRETCDVTDISQSVKKRKERWDEHITRMDHNTLVKAARDNFPRAERHVGRPRK